MQYTNVFKLKVKQYFIEFKRISYGKIIGLGKDSI